MPMSLDRSNQLIIKRILNRSNLVIIIKESDTSCGRLPFTFIFDELLGNNPFSYGEPRSLGPAEKVDIKDFG